jgi:phenylacetate-CoA ligase
MLKPIVASPWKYSSDYVNHSLETLETALSRVPLYRSWQRLDPGPLYVTDTRFAALPALTKKDIRDNFPLGLIPAEQDIRRGLDSGEISMVETSGTTDDKVTNIWNQAWWDASERASWKLNSFMKKVATGNQREAILVNPKNVGIKSDEIELPMEKRRLDRFLYLNEKTDPLTWSNAIMDRMIKELNIFQPAVLEVNPSYLSRLCRYITATEQSVFQPGVIVFTYEYPANFHYRQISAVFPSTPLVSSYGTTETGYVFMQCEAGKLHQNSDFCRVDFQPFKAQHGGPLLGRILVTPLNNPWNYLVRFDTGDIVRIEESGKCACGRNSGLILSAIAGRKVNLTLTCSGRLVTLLELDNIMSCLNGTESYQLIQTAAGCYELHLVNCRPDTRAVKAEAISSLRKLYGKEARIKVIQEMDIAPEGSGKYLVAKSMIPLDLDLYLDKRVDNDYFSSCS